MLPSAYIIHQLANRLRIRIPEMRQDQAYFDSVGHQLQQLSVITDVTTSATTGSILIQHTSTSMDELLAIIERIGLFELTAEAAPATPALEPLMSSMSGLNRAISEGTAGSIDLRTVAITAVAGIAIHQLFRGNLAGPAIPLLISTFNLAQGFSMTAGDEDA